MGEVFYILIQYGGHWPHVAPEHLKCDQNDLGTELLIVFNFNSLKCKEPHVAVVDWIRQLRFWNIP